MNVEFPSAKALLCALVILLVAGGSCQNDKNKETRVLVFSKTAAFRHESIEVGIDAIRKLGQKHHFLVDTTENASQFNEENLRRYSAVIFLSTTGDVLNQQQQNDFERFIQAGGGYVGIHAAADTEYDWPWYGKLVGAYFESHPSDPNVKTGTFYTVDKSHPASDSLPDRFERTDEFYSYKNINPDIKVLVKIDEKTYTGGTNGDNHPMAWYHNYDGGRAFYTAMGHTKETYDEPLFLRHLWGGISYALGGNDRVALDYMKAHSLRVPDENRFTKVVLDEKLEEPVELAVLPKERVLFIERRGNVKLYDPEKKQTKIIAKIPVSTKYRFKDGNQSEAEDGLLGLAIDPAFERNNWIYLYYSPAGDEAKNVLTRYELRGDSLIGSSKKVILEVATQREQCCHTGGSIAFDAHGNLFVSTGDNTSPRATAYAPMDQRPGRSPWDAQKGSANTNDLRGKVLRIHPEADGTYTIPDGNLFPKGTAKTRPEIYTMGARNPYRISVDKKTGYLYWGDVGPDAGKDSVNRGPIAFDEINQARSAGFYGWPYFVGDNQAYYERDFATGKAGAIFNPEKPVNNSVNNTGLNDLPPARKAFIWYPYDESKEFPLVGKGGRTAMAGPVFYSEDFKNAKRAFPDYYNDKLFIYEWMRGWIMAVTMNKEGDYVSMERFMPSYKFANPMDMEFNHETGDLYILEYGTAWFQGNEDARLVRIEFNGGNRKPAIRIAADKPNGAVPLAVALNSKGTVDYDHDELSYAWTITGPDNKTISTFKEAEPKITFDKPGIYTASLTVTDTKGESNTAKLDIQAGNEPPKLAFDITDGNQTFFFLNHSFNYTVKVTDKEDGTLDNGISPDQVSVNIDYLSEGFDQVAIAQGHKDADASAQFATGKKLMDDSDCKACHIIDKKSVGPTLKDIAAKYKDDPAAVDRLAKKIINGGGGVWGDAVMAAHPQISVANATEIVKYIMSLGQKNTRPSLPVKGTYAMTVPKGTPESGVFILRAAYTDKGANGLPPATAEKTMVLKSATVPAGKADHVEGVQKYKLPEPPIELMIASGNNAHIGFNNVDLTGIAQIVFTVTAPEQMLHAAGGIIEVHIDSPTGPLIGQTEPIVPQKGDFQKTGPILPAAKITPTAGKHDIYFVCRNNTSPAGQSLFIMMFINYIPVPQKPGTISMK